MTMALQRALARFVRLFKAATTNFTRSFASGIVGAELGQKGKVAFPTGPSQGIRRRMRSAGAHRLHRSWRPAGHAASTGNGPGHHDGYGGLRLLSSPVIIGLVAARTSLAAALAIPALLLLGNRRGDSHDGWRHPARRGTQEYEE